MKVGEFMTHAVVSVDEEAPFTEIVTKLLDGNMSGVPVVDASGVVVGVVTESDLLAKEAYPPGTQPKRGFLASLLGGKNIVARKAVGLTAKELMSSPPICVSPNESIHAAARAMLDAGIKRLPVVDRGRLVGIISRQDALRVFARTDADLQRSVVSLLQRCFFVPPQHDIHVQVQDGVVRLEGVVFYESDVPIVAIVVAECDGVVDVVNALRFRNPDPAEGFAQPSVVE